MNERERKVIAFLLGVVFELVTDGTIDENKTKQIANLMDEFGTADLDEQEFRY